MQMPLIRALLTCILCITIVCGCGRKQQLAVVGHPAPEEPPETSPQTLTLRPLSQLLPHQVTHLASDSLREIYWVQESASGQDMLFVSGQDDIPRPTPVATNAILAAFGPVPEAHSGTGLAATTSNSGSGNIQSIAIDSDGNVLFFFSGGIGRSTRVCLGQYNPHDQSIRILAGTQTLAAAAQMGASIGLARGQIIQPIATPAGEPAQYWLWLRHSDSALFLRFNPRAVEPGQPTELSRAFGELSGKDAPPNLTAEELEFSAGANGALMMIDWRTASLWNVNETGGASRWISLLGLPRDLSEPTARAGGIAIAFAPNGDPAVGTEGDGQSMQNAHPPPIRYPSLLAFKDDQIIPVATIDDILAPPTVDVSRLQFRTILPTITPHQWIGYDAASGIVMRIEIAPRN